MPGDTARGFRPYRHGATLTFSVRHPDTCRKLPFSIAHPAGGIAGIFGGTFLILISTKPALAPCPNVLRLAEEEAPGS